MLDLESQRFPQTDRIDDVPAIQAVFGAQILEVRAHVGAAVIGERGWIESPGHEEVVFGARALDGRLRLAVDVETGVALAEPEGTTGTDGHHGPDVVALPRHA